MNILVTGIAGDIGNGIGRILRASGFAAKLIGCDLHNQHGGQFVFDACELLPRSGMPGYIEGLLRIIKRHEIELIVPTSEPELRLFSELGISSIEGTPLLMANSKAREVGFDKLNTARFLALNGLPFPWTETVADNDPEELPCIVKSRFGAGAQEVRTIQSPDLVSAYRQIFTEHIWQECLGTAEEEYTCGVYRSIAGDVRSLVFRRRLSAGVTTYGEVVVNPEIDHLCSQIAAALDLNGSINIQLRLTGRGPVVFEINPRFSSTVVFRHKLGFEDVVWSICEMFGRNLPEYNTKSKVGTKIVRNFEEIII